MPSRYTIIGTLSAGGMGTVFLARIAGSAGFSRLVAIKRLHPQLAAQSEFIAMMVDEARLASQIRHANVVDTLDLVASDGALSLVLEYVEGASLGVLLGERRRVPVPVPIALAIVQGFLRGLDAAHEARGAEGQPLGIVHRDVSPQNVLVGIDGVPRVIDFGIAKALGRMTQTRPGEVRGKFAYMAPEQLQGRPATRQVDVYASGVILWELLTGRRLFTADDQRALASIVIRGQIDPPSSRNPAIPAELDAIVLQATARELSDRYLTARELLDALAPFPRASDDEVGAWVRETAASYLARRTAMLQDAVPEQSRSIDELLAELARSGSEAAPREPRAHATMTSAGIEVSAPRRAAGGAHLGIYVACAGVVLAIVGGAIGLQRRAAHRGSTAPPPASVEYVPVGDELRPPVTVAPATPPAPTGEPVAEPTGTTTPVVPATAPPRRRTRPVSTTTKKDDFAYP